MQPSKQIEFRYLEGMRGITALFICIGHLFSPLHLSNGIGDQWAVAVFIVLSGYCLTLPTETSRDLKGVLGFFICRFR